MSPDERKKIDTWQHFGEKRRKTKAVQSRYVKRENEESPLRSRYLYYTSRATKLKRCCHQIIDRAKFFFFLFPICYAYSLETRSRFAETISFQCNVTFVERWNKRAAIYRRAVSRVRWIDYPRKGLLSDVRLSWYVNFQGREEFPRSIVKSRSMSRNSGGEIKRDPRIRNNAALIFEPYSRVVDRI